MTHDLNKSSLSSDDTSMIDKSNQLLPVSPITTLSLRDHSEPAAYVLSHASSGKRYVGSTENLYARVHLHKSRLKSGTHDNKNLQEAYNNDPLFSLSAVFTDSKESALDIEQQLLDEGHESGDLFNIATDARRSRIGDRASDHTRKLLSEIGKTRNADPAVRASLSEKLKVAMSDPVLRTAQAERAKRMMDDPEHKAKMIAATSRPVTVDGVSYPSIKEASAKTGIKYGTLVSRLARERNR